MQLDVVVVSDDEEETVLRCTGAIDITSRAELTDVVRPLIGGKRVVIDLSGVTFIDSTGIGALVELSNDIEDAGGSLQLRDPTPRAQRLLDMTGLAERWG